MFSVQTTGCSSPAVSDSLAEQVTWCKYYIFALLFNLNVISSTFPRPSAVLERIFDNLLHLSQVFIEKYNHRMVWVVSNLKEHLVPTPWPWAETPFLSNIHVNRWHCISRKGSSILYPGHAGICLAKDETHPALCKSVCFFTRIILTGDQVPRCYSAVIFLSSTPTLYIKNFINHLCAN